jgi:uncharacterized protein (DUF885 family)
MRRNGWALVCALCVASVGCTSTSAPSPAGSSSTTVEVQQPTMTTPAVPTTAGNGTGGDFVSIVDGITIRLLQSQPQLVTDVGAGSVTGLELNGRLDDVSASGPAALAAIATKGLEELETLERDRLTTVQAISAEVLAWYLSDLIALDEFADYDNPVSFITGAHTNFAEFMADVHPITNRQDAADYVARLEAFRAQIDQVIGRLQAQDAAGIVPAQRSLDIARYQIGAAIGTSDPSSHPLVTDLAARIESLPDADPDWIADTIAAARTAVANQVRPALQDLDRVIRGITGRSAAESGVWALPGGDEYYAAALHHHLGLDLQPGEVYDLGVAQVARVRGELVEALGELGYDAARDFSGAIVAAARDAGSLPTGNEIERAQVLSTAAALVDDAESTFSDIVPAAAAPLEVVRPRPEREGGSGAYYRSPPIDGSRPGIYYLSLGGSGFDLLTLATTTYHEAVPGHHLQLAGQRSDAALPLHQRVFDFTGFAEGWGLYAERLAYEAGLYDHDPYGNIGRLRLELLRAVRMVADTGIHYKRWSRNEAIAYMRELGFGEAQAAAEVDRYIVWPGQAPAYMVGMLEILRLRDEAQQELGDGFDLAGFQEAVLGAGSVPLELLDDVVAAWVAGPRDG